MKLSAETKKMFLISLFSVNTYFAGVALTQEYKVCIPIGIATLIFGLMLYDIAEYIKK